MGIDRRRYLMMTSARKAAMEKVGAAYVRHTSGSFINIQRSLDGGSTWSTVVTNIGSGGMIVDVDENLIYNNSTGLYLLTAAGEKQSLPKLTGNQFPLCQSSGSEFIFHTYRVYSGGKYSTTIYRRDGREATDVQKTYLSPYKVNTQKENAMACSEDGRFICMGGDGSQENGVISRDYGNTWTKTSESSSYGFSTIDMSNSGQYTVMCSGTEDGTVHVSTDNLATIHPTVSFKATEVSSVAISGNGEVMYAYATYPSRIRGFYRSYDHGNSWQYFKNNSFIKKMVTSYNGQLILAMDSTNLFRSNDYGVTWTTVPDIAKPEDVVLNKYMKF